MADQDKQQDSGHLPVFDIYSGDPRCYNICRGIRGLFYDNENPGSDILWYNHEIDVTDIVLERLRWQAARETSN